MPWTVKKNGNKYNIIKSDTGEIVGTSDTKEKAEASVRARYANVDEDFKKNLKKAFKNGE